MNKENENVELIDEEEIITLYDENDKPVEFYEVACVDYENNFYAILEPKEKTEGIEDGEVVIFKLEEQEDGSDLFVPIEDEKLLQAVFDEYLKKAEEDGCGCGCCDCDSCEHEH